MCLHIPGFRGFSHIWYIRELERNEVKHGFEHPGNHIFNILIFKVVPIQCTAILSIHVCCLEETTKCPLTAGNARFMVHTNLLSQLTLTPCKVGAQRAPDIRSLCGRFFGTMSQLRGPILTQGPTCSKNPNILRTRGPENPQSPWQHSFNWT